MPCKRRKRARRGSSNPTGRFAKDAMNITVGAAALGIGLAFILYGVAIVALVLLVWNAYMMKRVSYV